MTDGTTHFMRYPHWQSACPEVWKRGVIYGEIYKMVQNTSPNVYDLLWKPLWLLVRELQVQGYPLRYIKKVVDKVEILKLPIHQLGTRVAACTGLLFEGTQT